MATTNQLSVYLDLSGLTPTPDRLMEIVRLLGEAGVTRLFLDWQDSFPWTFCPSAPHGFPEVVVAGVAGAASDAGVALLPVLPIAENCGFLHGCAGFDRFFLGPEGGIDWRQPGLPKKLEDLVDDLLGLLPDTKGILVGEASVAREPSIRLLASYFAKRGIDAWFRTSIEDGEVAEAGPGCRVLRVVRDEVGWLNGAAPQPEDGSRLYWISTMTSFGGHQSGSIEFVLHRLVSDAAAGRRSLELDLQRLRFEAALRRGWDSVRTLRQSIISLTRDRRRQVDARGGFRASLSRLSETYEEAALAGRSLGELLRHLVHPVRLADYLAEHLVPLQEEIAILGARGAAFTNRCSERSF